MITQEVARGSCQLGVADAGGEGTRKARTWATNLHPHFQIDLATRGSVHEELHSGQIGGGLSCPLASPFYGFGAFSLIWIASGWTTIWTEWPSPRRNRGPIARIRSSSGQLY